MFKFDTRKLMRMNYTRYLALPPTWLKSMGLQPGDPIQIEMDEDQRLILSPAKCEKLTSRGDAA